MHTRGAHVQTSICRHSQHRIYLNEQKGRALAMDPRLTVLTYIFPIPDIAYRLSLAREIIVFF